MNGQILKCLVEKVIVHPGDLNNESLETIKKNVGAAAGEPAKATFDSDISIDDEAKIVHDMPRNSIIAIPIGPTNQIESLPTRIICYPFFSSHLTLPIKAGEFAWIFSESGLADVVNPGIGPFYWMSRVHGSLLSEDANFSHYERQFEDNNLSVKEADHNSDKVIEHMKEYRPGFTGDMFVPEALKNTSYNILEKSMSHESVPRFTKNPGDLVFQGSNNTLISLGTSIKDNRDESLRIDETSSADIKNSSRAKYNNPGSNKYSGAIDIVVGRAPEIDTVKSSAGLHTIARPMLGQCLTINNDKDFIETKKNPTFLDTGKSKEIQHPRHYNMQEGDPNFSNDASRIYLSQNSDPDKDFDVRPIMANSLYSEGLPVNMGDNKAGSTTRFHSDSPPNEVYPLLIDDDGPSIVAKSKNLRIIARSIDHESRVVWAQKGNLGSNEDEDIEKIKLDGEQGSIIILKEGKLVDEPLEDLYADPAIPRRAPPQIEDIEYPITEGPFSAEHASEAGNGRAVIALGADGTIYIDGPRIIIGSGNEKEHGMGTQVSLGLEATEPIVLGNELKDLLDKFFTDLKAFMLDTFDNHVHPSSCGGTQATPNNSTTMQTGIDAAKSDLINTLSKIGKTR
jgi:hypothetical protein